MYPLISADSHVYPLISADSLTIIPKLVLTLSRLSLN